MAYISNPRQLAMNLGRAPNRMAGSGRRRGGSAFTDFFTKTIPRVASDGWNYVKRRPLTAIGSLGSFLPGPFGTVARGIGIAGRVSGLGRRRRRVYRRRRRGGSIGSILKKAHQFVKDRRLVSGALKHFGHTKLSASARALGYGRVRRRRRVYRRRRGGSIGSILKKAHQFVKDRRLVSGALKHFGHAKLSASARALGYGRRRRRVYRRRRGGSIGSILKKAHQFVKDRRLVSGALKHFGHAKLSASARALGYGRRRRRRVVRRRGRGPLLNMARAGITGLRNMARKLGYGRSRRRRVYRRRR